MPGFRVRVHLIGCALRAPHQTPTSVPEREVKKTISPSCFLGVRPSGASPDPRVGPLGETKTGNQQQVAGFSGKSHVLGNLCKREKFFSENHLKNIVSDLK